jgi:hypothetical protein
MDRTFSRSALFVLLMFALALSFPHLAHAAPVCEITCWGLDNCSPTSCEADGPSATCCCTGTGEAFCSSYPVPMNPCEYSSTVTRPPQTDDQFLKSLSAPQK